jgi:hypothetical protein
MTEQVPEVELGLENESRNFDPYSLPFYKAMRTLHWERPLHDSSPCPRPICMEADETEASWGVSHSICPTALECGFVDGRKEQRIFLWNEIYYLT